MNIQGLLIEYHNYLLNTNRLVLPEKSSIIDTVKEFRRSMKLLTLRQFMELSENEMSIRLYNSLKYGSGYNLDNTLISEVKIKDLRRLRNFGIKCEREFILLKEKYTGE